MDQDLITDLTRLGIRVRLVEDKLDVRAPVGVLTPELRERLTVNRDALVAVLRRSAAPREVRRLAPDPENRFEPFPLTDVQQAYWLGLNRAFELGGQTTHFYFELQRPGLDPDRLDTAFRRVIERHDMLRATVLPDGHQQVHTDLPDWHLPVVDLRGRPAADAEAALDRVRAEMADQVLVPDRWPLFDLRAHVLDGGEVRLHVSLSLLILDAYSIYLLFRDWRRFYEDPDGVVEPLAVHYRDHVLAEQADRAGPEYAQARAYWLGRLDELPPAPELPLAVRPSQLPEAAFTRRRSRMPAARWDALRKLGRGHGLTPSTVLLTAFSEVLRVWSKQPAFTLNLTLFNRPPVHPQIRDVLGDFTSLTLLAVDAGPVETFAARGQRVQQQLMQDLEHVAYGGVRTQRELARRIGSGPAAMPVVFTSAVGVADDGVSADDLAYFGEYVYGISQTPQVWLDNQVMEEHGDLVVTWDCVEALFPGGLLDDMFGALRDLLDRLADDPAAWEGTALVSAPAAQLAERDRVNDSALPLPAATLPALVTAQAARTPDAVAVTCEDEEVTYRELVARAARLAHRLVQLGAGTGRLVGIVLDRGPDQVAAALGVTMAGAAYLPIDAHWPVGRRDQLLGQGRVRIVVTSPELRDGGPWPVGVEVVTPADLAVRGADPVPPDTAPAPGDLAYVIFTSGSTGTPKGVMIDHRGAVNTVQDINQRFGVGPADRVLALSALSFDLSVYDVFGMLAAGGTVVLPSPRRSRDPEHWSELVTGRGVTMWNSVPALMQAWLDSPAVPAAPPLRLALLSGDWIPVALPDLLRAHCPEAEVISLGGATEASIWSVYYPIGEVPPGWTSIPYGKPLANQTLHVLDDRLRPCPVWTVGEIHIGGVGVALGYWADPERTAERFVTDPSTGERVYRTGDLGRYLPGGDIEFLGREDAQVKLNGYRIELGEIAASLRRQPGVGEALVRVDTNERTGRRQLVAYVLPAGSDTASGPVAERGPAALAAGEAELARASVELGPELAAYGAMWRVMEDLCVPVMARTLARLGILTTAGESVTAAEVVTRAGGKPQYEGVVRQWLATLADRGLLSGPDGADRFRCDRPLDAGEHDRQVRAGFAAGDVPAAYRPLWDYLAACADRQVELLRGQVSPLELLLPGGSWDLVDVLYARNPVSALQNRATAALVRSVVEGSPADRPVRILEVGAGTGSTAAVVVPALPAGRFRYHFTDVSTFFTERAAARFGGHPELDFGVCDIDRDLADQGFGPGSVDVIVAANVLHDARDLGRSLRNLRATLAPGGLLTMIEGTVNSPIQALTVGFIEAFSHHQGQHELPLLSVPGWRDRLADAGFGSVAAVPAEGASTDFMVQHVVVGQAAAGIARPEPEQLKAALGGLLPEYMVPHHFVPIDRLPLSANGKVDPSALPTPWAEQEQHEAVPPRDDRERRVLAIWHEALGREDFGVEDNFFELGGDSLHAVQILGRLREEFGLLDETDDGLVRVFENPSVAGLAATLVEDEA